MSRRSTVGAPASNHDTQQSLERKSRLMDIDTALNALHELQGQSGEIDLEKKFIHLGKDSPIIPLSGAAAPGSNRLDKVLGFYGVLPSAPHTPEELRSAIAALENIRSEVSLDIYHKDVHMEELVDDASNESILEVVAEEVKRTGMPFLSYLSAHASPEVLGKAKAAPATFLEALSRMPQAGYVVKKLMKKLGWEAASQDGFIPLAVMEKLLLKAIALSLDPPSSRKEGQIAGFDMAPRGLRGKSYQEINSDFQQHLINSKRVSNPVDAELATYVLKSKFPVEFSVGDIPPDLPYEGSIAWVNFKHGVELAEMLEPGSSRRMGFQALMDLPARKSEEATTDEQRAAIAWARMPSTMAWAVANGIIPEKTEYAEAEVNKAVTALDQHISEVTDAVAKLGADVPLRKDYFERMGTAVSRTELLSLLSPFFAYYRHGSGETISPADLVYKYPIYDDKQFDTAFDSFLNHAKSAYEVVTKAGLSQLKPDEIEALDKGAVTLYSLRVKLDPDNTDDETAEDKKAALIRPVFIAKAVHEGQTSYYEVNPQLGIMQRRDDLNTVFRPSGPNDGADGGDIVTMNYSSDKTLVGKIVVRNRQGIKEEAEQFNRERMAGKNPPPIHFLIGVPIPLATFAPAAGENNLAPNTLTSTRFNEIAKAISTKLFYVDEDVLRKQAASDPERESSAEKNDEAFWARVKGAAQLLIPFWSGIEDIVNGQTAQGIAGILLDGFFAFASPVGKFVGGSVKLFSSAGKVGIRSVLPQFANLVKALGISVVRNLNPLDPVMSGMKFSGKAFFKSGSAALKKVEAGIEQFKAAAKLPRRGRYDVSPGKPRSSKVEFVNEISINANKLKLTKLGGTMDDLRESASGLYTFVDLNKKGKKVRLNILAHGVGPETSYFKTDVTTPARIFYDGKHNTPQELYDTLLAKGIDPSDYDSVRLLVCYSGNGRYDSFAAEFSRIIKRPVKGYEGTLAAYVMPNMISDFSSKEEGKFVQALGGETELLPVEQRAVKDETVKLIKDKYAGAVFNNAKKNPFWNPIKAWTFTYKPVVFG